jgi:23S rRNA pseudouridine2605 synthase
MEERLQKIIARAGIASRRAAEQLILSGQVTVNGTVITEMGTRADAEKDHIKVSGKLLPAPERRVYYAFHKPTEVVATLNDPEMRRSLSEFTQRIPERVFPLGRLEYHAAGLLILTNDGELTNQFFQAHRVPQRFVFKTKGILGTDDLEKLERATGARLQRLGNAPNPWYEVALSNPGSDSVRTQLERMDHPVEKTRRIEQAGVELGPLGPGRFRPLTEEEVTKLRRTIQRSEELTAKSRELEIRTAEAAGAVPEAKGQAGIEIEKPEWKGKQQAGGGSAIKQFGGARAPFTPNKKKQFGGGGRPKFGEPRKQFGGGAGKPPGDGPRKPFGRGFQKPRGENAPPGFGERPRKQFGGGPRKHFGGSPQNRFGGGERRGFVGGEGKPQGGGPRKPFGRGFQKPRGENAPPGFGDRPRKQFGGGPRKNFGGAPRKPFGEGPQKGSGGGPQKRFGGGAPKRFGGESRSGPPRGGHGQGKPTFRPAGNKPFKPNIHRKGKPGAWRERDKDKG